MFPRKLSGFGAAAKSFPAFALLCLFAAVPISPLFAALRLCVRFFASSLASELIPFSFFLQEAYRFFHRRAGNDRNVGRIMELTDYG
jgi:hypothetical protein